MKKQKHYFAIGLFIVVGFALFTLACVLFGRGQLFAKKMYFETYFNTSVSGLDVGSAVKFRGVHMGEVEKITLANAVYCTDVDIMAADHDMKCDLLSVRVLCSIDLEQHPNVSPQLLRDFVEKDGLCARLESSGITGGAFVAIDFGHHKVSPAPPRHWTAETVYVPSIPSTMQNVVGALDQLSEQLKEINFSEMADTLNSMVESVHTAVSGAEIPKLSKAMTDLAQNLSTQVDTIQRILTEIEGAHLGADLKAISSNLSEISSDLKINLPAITQSAQTTLDEATQLLAETNTVLKDFRAAVDPEVMGSDVEDAVQSLARTTAALEALVNELRAKPSRIIFDDPLE